ncbi:MAG: pyruvate dehydrogenase complex dihydrolipoamide acetyltransferase [Gemmatimonadota bacterium]
MATKVVMAQLSPTMEEGKLLEWKLDEGAEVSQGDVVAEIETDKANMDVEALGSGVLRKILVQAGETVPVGALIGVIAAPDEDIEELLEEARASAGSAARSGSAASGEASAPPPEVSGTAPAGVAGRAGAGSGDVSAAPPSPARSEESPDAAGGRVKASPVARKMARERGLDLTAISGSGPGGRIVKSDVAAAGSRAASPTGAGPSPPAPPSPAGLRDEVLEASQMRKAIARRLVQSLGPVPHFFLTTEIDMERALEMRADVNRRRPEEKIGVNDLLLKATAEALARHPEVNASWVGEAIRRHGSVDLGIAVAVEEGLITPVLRSAERKSLRQISREARELIARARDRKLRPEEYQGATFSVSNLGMFEIDEFTAVINPPEAGILAVGRTTEKPVVVEGEVTVRRRMRVTMSCDHRVVDGATGAAFLRTVKAMLENPLEMVL